MNMSLSKLREIQYRTEEPGVLQSMGSQRVRHDLATEKPPKIGDHSRGHPFSTSQNYQGHGRKGKG